MIIYNDVYTQVAVGMVGRACPRWEATGEAIRGTLGMASAMQVRRLPA